MAEKRKGPCDACGNKPRVLTQIDSGQWLCRTCLRVIRPSRPKNLVTPHEIKRARSLGYDLPDDAAKADVDEILLTYESVKWYVYDVWEQMTGERPIHSHVPQDELRVLVKELARDRPLAARICRIEEGRYEAMCERSDAAKGAIYDPLVAEHGTDESDRIQDELADNLEAIPFKSFKVPPPRDADFKAVAGRLRELFGDYMPRRGLLSRLLGE